MSNNAVVLDTSAVFAFLEDEPGGDAVRSLLEAAKDRKQCVLVPFVVLTEVRYILIQEKSEDEADRAIALMRAWPVEWVHSDDKLCLLAAGLKARFRISLADAYVAAAAKLASADLVHKDPAFEAVEGAVTLAALPYTPKQKRS